MVDEQLGRVAACCGLSEIWPALKGMLRPCYTIEVLEPGTEASWFGRLLKGQRPAVGMSRFGGWPDLPDSVAWPERRGGKLGFVGQINLADCPQPPEPVPPRGWLYFFWGTDQGRLEHSVEYWNGDTERMAPSKRAPKESLLNPDQGIFQPTPLRFHSAWSLPALYMDPSYDQYSDQLDEFRNKVGKTTGAEEVSRFLGYPTDFSGNPLDEAYVVAQGHSEIICDLNRSPEQIELDIRAALAEGDVQGADWLRRKKKSLEWYHSLRELHVREAQNWQLLLEVGSHGLCGMNWGDYGVLQFLIDSRDLGAGNFAKTYACIQSN
jgi:hypothetical protein